mgnify:FL=1
MNENVYSEILDGDVLTRLSGQFLHARQPMVGNIVGHHKSPYRGSSVEFAEYRKYVPGDDPRLLDWRVLARTDRYYIREFEADTNLRCYVVVDCSKSMSFGEKGMRKFDYARKIAATLSYMLVHQGDAVGLEIFDDGVQKDIPPRRNPLHLRYIFDTIVKAEPRGETGLVAELHQFAERIRQRAMVIIISDCFCDVDELLNCFEHLHFQKHDFALFHLLDPLELDLALDRPIRFQDLESNDVLLAEPEIIRDQYIEAVHEYLVKIHEGCNKHNADYRRVSTDQPYDSVIADFLIDREQLAKGRG